MGEKKRIWHNDNEKYYEIVVALMLDQKEGELVVNELKVRASKESNKH